MKHRSFQLWAAFLLALYGFLILCYTVFLRPMGFYPVHLSLFWSYRAWFGGDLGAGVEDIANIALFVPFGFLLSACRKKPAVLPGLLAGLLLSCLVEALQWRLMRGHFELDDLFNNSLGSLLGCFGWRLLENVTGGKTTRRAALSLGAAAILAAAILCAADTRVTTDDAARHYFLQVDAPEAQGEQLTLRGFAFWFDHEAKTAKLYLRSTKTGKKLPLRVVYGLERPDVDAHFRCAYDYSHCGFSAVGSGIRPDEEYQLYAAVGWPVPLPTGIWIRGETVHYAPEASFRAPEGAGSELAELLRDSVLRLYRADLPCWVYQRGSSLYWIVERSYPFEADGTTTFQYLLYTTQTDRLPPERVAQSRLWINRNDAFEHRELEGDFGPYRVMQRELPEELTVSAVVTGYWSKDHWVWRDCFHPYYETLTRSAD